MSSQNEGGGAGAAPASLFDFSGLRISDAELQALEKKQGVGAGYVDANASKNADAVACKITTAIDAGGFVHYGSGALVDGTSLGLPRYCLLTNHHVLSTADEARGATCLFGYEDGLPTRKHQEVGLRPDDGFVAHREEGRLDFAIVACDEDAAKAVELNDRKLRPLKLDAEARVDVHTPISIVQHPRGGTKKSVIWTPKEITPSQLAYEADTEPGSSGSPVYNNMHQLVGVHYAGVAGEANFGCRLSAIVAYVAELRKRQEERRGGGDGSGGGGGGAAAAAAPRMPPQPPAVPAVTAPSLAGLSAKVRAKVEAALAKIKGGEKWIE